MAHEDDLQLRLSAQRALLGNITPSTRAVSVEVSPEQRRASVRFIFDGEPSPYEEETASVAHTEILSDFVDEWAVELEMVRTPAPQRMEHLRLVVFQRCEDERVRGKM
jgi:hypothetical protein